VLIEADRSHANNSPSTIRFDGHGCRCYDANALRTSAPTGFGSSFRLEMLFYAHLCLAKLALERGGIPIRNPGDISQYYLGAALPDIRYISGQPRDQTHPAAQDFLKLHHPPELYAFCFGYLVHLVIDELEAGLQFNELVRRQFARKYLVDLQ